MTHGTDVSIFGNISMRGMFCHFIWGLVLFCFLGVANAQEVVDPFEKNFEYLEDADPADDQDPADSTDVAEAYDAEDPYDDIDSLSQDTPDTDEILMVHQTKDTVKVKKPKVKKKFWGIHNEFSYVTADVAREKKFYGGHLAMGVSREWFIYSLSTFYALAVVSGANLGFVTGFSEYYENRQLIDEPMLEIDFRGLVSIPLTIESKVDLFFWKLLYDVGFQTDIFFWDYVKRTNSIHESTDKDFCFEPALYVVFGAGNWMSLWGHRLEYIFRTTHSVLGYHVGKKREVRASLVTNFWF